MHGSDRYTDGNGQARAMARALGWFSIALGVAELVKPGSVRKAAGAPAPRKLVQAYGLRELASGAAILMSPNPNQMVWTRVAGDMVDIATLVPGLSSDNPRRQGTETALAFVALVTAVDIFTAMQDGRASRRPIRDYSDRSGFPQGIAYARRNSSNWMQQSPSGEEAEALPSVS